MTGYSGSELPPGRRNRPTRGEGQGRQGRGPRLEVSMPVFASWGFQLRCADVAGESRAHAARRAPRDTSDANMSRRNRASGSPGGPAWRRRPADRRPDLVTRGLAIHCRIAAPSSSVEFVNLSIRLVGPSGRLRSVLERAAARPQGARRSPPAQPARSPRPLEGHRYQEADRHTLQNWVSLKCKSMKDGGSRLVKGRRTCRAERRRRGNGIDDLVASASRRSRPASGPAGRRGRRARGRRARGRRSRRAGATGRPRRGRWRRAWPTRRTLPG